MQVGRSVWHKCLDRLQDELSSQQYNTWIRPLQACQDDDRLRILAPNRYVKNQVQSAYLDRITELLENLSDPDNPLDVVLDVGATTDPDRQRDPQIDARGDQERAPVRADGSGGIADRQSTPHKLNSDFNFSTFVEGKSNEMAKAAAPYLHPRLTGVEHNYNPEAQFVIVAPEVCNTSAEWEAKVQARLKQKARQALPSADKASEIACNFDDASKQHAR